MGHRCTNPEGKNNKSRITEMTYIIIKLIGSQECKVDTP